jgi:hypothetical protein
MVFDSYGTDRLIDWKNFRDSLELSNNPFEEVVEFWSKAPFVSSYLDPNNPNEWPDPWHLILDLRLDDLAIALGMLYTIKLTRRFMASDCEIHMSMPPDNKDPIYFLIVDNQHVLNLEYKKVKTVSEIKNIETNKIWPQTKQQ